MVYRFPMILKFAQIERQMALRGINTYKQLGVKMKLSQQGISYTMCRIKMGMPIRPANANRLAKALKIELDELIEG